MERCSPVEMRKTLVVVEEFKKHGIGFIAIPYQNEGHKNELMQQSRDSLQKMAYNALVKPRSF